MHQLAKLGGGEVKDGVYTTWTIQTCPVCMKKVVEYYSTFEVTDEDAKNTNNIKLTVSFKK